MHGLARPEAAPADWRITRAVLAEEGERTIREIHAELLTPAAAVRGEMDLIAQR
ncbi:hypothetical protein ACFV1W_22730 [Kitasatospora sp. NPDC059648]|uniref:hypothetical protein n=1 Tax=Kitasatospora sp. NPDC059648 TaxID=3346894 RepID=UPI0036AAB9CF